jgi:tripeptidyl-peptidase-1
VQTTQSGFQFNGESDLDLQYAMNLVTAGQEVTLYQVGDQVEGAIIDAFRVTGAHFYIVW